VGAEWCEAAPDGDTEVVVIMETTERVKLACTRSTSLSLPGRYETTQSERDEERSVTAK